MGEGVCVLRGWERGKGRGKEGKGINDHCSWKLVQTLPTLVKGMNWVTDKQDGWELTASGTASETKS